MAGFLPVHLIVVLHLSYLSYHYVHGKLLLAATVKTFYVRKFLYQAK